MSDTYTSFSWTFYSRTSRIEIQYLNTWNSYTCIHFSSYFCHKYKLRNVELLRNSVIFWNRYDFWHRHLFRKFREWIKPIFIFRCVLSIGVLKHIPLGFSSKRNLVTNALADTPESTVARFECILHIVC